MQHALDINSVLFTCGVVYGMMSLLAWALLHRRHHRVPVALWSLGGLCSFVALLLLAQRNEYSQPMWYGIGHALGLGSVALRVAALRFDLGRPTGGAAAVLRWALAVAPVWPLAAFAGLSWCLLYARSIYLPFVCALVWYAWQAGKSGPSRSGIALAAVEVLYVVAALGQVSHLLGHWDAVDTGTPKGWSFFLFTAVALVAATYSNLAYVGMAFDRSRAAEARAREAQAAETARREAAEASAAELRATLQQRDALAAERDRLLQVLAHEIRQPLHNAGGALQAAAQAIQPATSDHLRRADEPLRRARGVLDDVRSVLDNTLAAAVLLTRPGPLAVQDVELDMLVELVLGDLPEARRAAVRVVRDTTLRSAEIEPGLVRLALRNLLRNALAHAGRAPRIEVHIAEQARPPALLLSVADDGPGLAAPPAPPGAGAASGLGLDIVRRVMALHGGELQLSDNRPHGLRATLSFPLPAEDEPEAIPLAQAS